MASFDPYISDFEYSPEFHPSRNPSCPRRWARGAWEDRRSPDEGAPVGQEPSIEIRAVLVRCPKSQEEMSDLPASGNAYNITAGRSQDILEFHGFDRDEPAHHSVVRSCRRKLIVTMKFNNVGKTRTQEEFVVVDHVLDPVTMHKARLLNPFVFKVRQEQVLQLYGLKFQSVVNGEAKEEVVNKKSSNYTGCDDSLGDPTCGKMMFDGKPVLYSQGFCCSCDPDVNAKRQPTEGPSALALGGPQKMIPGRNDNVGPRTYGEDSIFASRDSGKSSLLKSERSLKSSEVQEGDGFDDPKYDSTAFREALSGRNPSRGKIEPYIDAVGSEIVEDVSGGLERPQYRKFRGQRRPGLRNEELTAELVKLESEYDALKKSQSRVDGRSAKRRAGETRGIGSRSGCKDFRKLARNRSSNVDPDLTRGVKRGAGYKSPDDNSDKRSSGSSATDPSSRYGPAITPMPGVDNQSISTLILRQELAGSKLRSGDADRLYYSAKTLPKMINDETIESRDRYADWVIKYAKTNNNRYVNSEAEDPYDPEDPVDDEVLDRSDDSLSQIADRVMKEFEAKESEDPAGQEEAEGFNRPEIPGSFEGLRVPTFDASVVRESGDPGRGGEANKNSSKSWKEVLSSKMNVERSIGPKKLTVDSNRAGIDTPVKKSVEPAVIVAGIGDMVKGNLEYRDQSATVIADRHSADVKSPTDQDYIFLDANGRERGQGDSNNSGVRSTGKKIIANHDRLARGRSMRETFDRLDNLVKDSLGSRRRAFRSVAYDDPFQRGNDQKQAAIDQKIEKEFAEITEALDEASDRRKNADRLSPPRGRIDASSGDSMLRDLQLDVRPNKTPGNNGMKKNFGVNRITERRRLSGSMRKEGSRPKPLGDPEVTEAKKMLSRVSPTVGTETAEKLEARSKIRKSAKTSSGRSRHPNLPAIRSSTRKYRVRESQPNMDEIVKQVIKNDYRVPPSRNGKQEYSSRHKSRVKGNGKKPDAVSSQKSVSHSLHVGKMQKKCEDSAGFTPFFSEEEKNGPQNLPHKKSTVTSSSPPQTTTSKAQNATVIGSEEPFTQVESTTLPAQETTVVSTDEPLPTSINLGEDTHPAEATASVKIPATIPPSPSDETKNNPASTPFVFLTPLTTDIQENGETEPVEIDIISQGVTPALTTAATSSSTESTSVKHERGVEGERVYKSGGAMGHSMMARSLNNSGGGESEVEATTYLQFSDGEFQYGDNGNSSESDVKEESNDALKSNDSRRTTGGEVTDDNAMPTTFVYNDKTTLEESGDERKTGSQEDVIFTTYVDNLASEESTATSSAETTTGTGPGITTEEPVAFPEQTTERITSESVPGLERPKSLDELLSSNKSRGSSVILVKTISVSQNPKEFLDNYEFPVGVKKVLLKKMNVTVGLLRDPESGESLTQKVNKLLDNEDRNAEDSEIPEKIDFGKLRIRHVGDFSLQDRRTVHGPKIGDLNEGEESPGDSVDLPNNEFVLNKGSKVGRSSTTVGTLPPDEETTHVSWDDDVNATHFQLNYVLEEPILARRIYGAKTYQRNKKRSRPSARGRRDDRIPRVEFFYDYDPDSDSNQAHPVAKRSCRASDVRPESRRRSLKKREVNDEEKELDGEPRCRDGEDLKWQGKMDILKLKKHQDILKEYLNWSPKVDTTVMRIYSVHSTIGSMPTTKNVLEKGDDKQEGSTMSILLIEDGAKEGSEASSKGAEAGQLGDEEILDKLRKMPIDDNLVIIPVTEKNKSNPKIVEPKRSSGTTKKRSLSKRGSKVGEKRRKRNINFSGTREGRSGRRLMSAGQLSENRDNGLLGVEDSGSEVVEKDEALPENGDTVPRGETSGFDYSDSSYKDQKRDELVDKVIVNNNGESKKCDGKKELDEPPSDRGKTAMEKLHVFDADKYIKIMAKKISRLSNVDNTEQDLGAERQAKVLNESRKGAGKNTVAFAEEDGGPASEDSMEPDYGDEIPYGTGPRLVKSLPAQDSIFGKLGSDFEISVSGKLHINGDQSDGQPMSISIEGVSVDNVTSSGDRTHSDSVFPPFLTKSSLGPSREEKNDKEFVENQGDRGYLENLDLNHVLQDADTENEKQTFFGEAPPNARINPEVFHPEGFRVPNTSPRKTFYNVVVRAHPRYEKWPVHESPEDLVDDVEDTPVNVGGKNSKNLAEDEPVFDFANLQLREGKTARRSFRGDQPSLRADPVRRSTRRSNSRRREARRPKEERTAGHGAPVEDDGLIEYPSPENLGLEESGRGGQPDIKLVKLIPVKLTRGENEERSLLEKKPGRLIAAELSKTGSGPDAKEGEIQPIGFVALDKKLESNGADAAKKNPESLDEGRSKQPRGTYALLRSAFEKASQNARPSKHRADPSGEEALIKGVKISSPGENSHDLPEQGDLGALDYGENEVLGNPEDAGKTDQLKDLMTVMNLFDNVKDRFPGSEDTAKTLDARGQDPKTVVQVQSVLLLPESDSETENDAAKTEKVVEIGEGVRHGDEDRRIVLFGNPTRKDGDKDPFPGRLKSGIILGGDKRKSSTSEGQAISEADSRLEDSKINGRTENVEDKKAEGAAGTEDLFREVERKIKHRLLKLERKASPGKRSEQLSPPSSVPDENLHRDGRKGADVPEPNNYHFLKDPRTRSSSEVKEPSNYPRIRSDVGLNLVPKDHHRGKVARPLSQSMTKINDDVNKEFEFPGTVTNTVDDPSHKEGPPGPERNERRAVAVPRQDRQACRGARTPVMYAIGVSEMGDGVLKGVEKELASVVNGRELNHEEKRKTKEDSEGVGMADKRERSKRRFRKGKKKKKKKHKHKKSRGKKKRKKWWPFKRNLLAISDDLEPRSGPRDPVQNSGPARKPKSEKSKRRKKRQIKAGGAQTRGGQDCVDRRHPAHVNAAKYQESAHCLRFSDLWYSVYELETPIMEHTVYLQLFEKHSLPDGTTHWDDLTRGSMVRLGTFVRHERDGAPTIAFTYSGPKTAPQKRSRNLDTAKDRLLVPSPVPRQKLAKYPEVEGGSGEYLVVKSDAINRDGNECDKAGVGFATFATQPDRCGHPKGTCLKNQPLAYWRHDVEAREAGRPGCYFLSNFASVPNNPIKYNVSGSGSREYLGLEYHSPHVSAIDIEVRADYNAVVRVGSSGRVTEVFVDSSSIEHTVVTIVISNMGLASSPYQSRLTDCPTGLPVSWSKAKGAMQVIAPQHDQRVTLDLYGQLYVDGFHCSVEVVNHRGELVAMRRIRVQKMDRCFCVWHCLCACVGSVAGLGCQPMSSEHYHAAGFQGSVPVASTEPSIMANAIKDVMLFSAMLVLLLLVLGVVKWVIGVFAPTVSRWGLDVLLEGKEIQGYFEPELCCRSIVTDVEGRIVHPDSGKKSVRICSRRSELFLNLIFFLTYPIAVCCNSARNSLAARRDCCEDESQVCLLKDESTATSSTKLICVSTYGESRNSKMEAEDTKYVMNELKRSRDSLQDGVARRSKAGLRLRK